MKTFFPLFLPQLKSSLEVKAKKFKINGDGANKIFIVDDNGDLFANQTLDREKQAVYYLTAQMFDGNGKMIENPGRFEIHVTDINDNRPVFPTTYNRFVPERSSKGVYDYLSK